MAIAVLDDYQRCAADFADWDSLGEPVDFIHEHLDGDALINRISPAEVVVAMRERTPFDAAVLQRLPNLRLLVTTGMRNASIDLAAAIERGVTVCGTRGVAGSAAEMTWALIHAVTRAVPASDAAVKDGRWQETIGMDLAGSRLGVIGLGRLGTRVAVVARAFDMDVVAWSQNLDTAHARSLGVTPVTKEELLATSDIVSLHLKLSARTHGILGPKELGLLRPGAIVINTSRGPLVDEAALLTALRSGRIRAGLDVYDTEPLPTEHPLRSMPNVVLTPHIGYVTQGTYELFFGDAVEDVRAWRDGTPLRILS